MMILLPHPTTLQTGHRAVPTPPKRRTFFRLESAGDARPGRRITVWFGRD